MKMEKVMRISKRVIDARVFVPHPRDILETSKNALMLSVNEALRTAAEEHSVEMVSARHLERAYLVPPECAHLPVDMPYLDVWIHESPSTPRKLSLELMHKIGERACELLMQTFRNAHRKRPSWPIVVRILHHDKENNECLQTVASTLYLNV